MKFSIFNLLFFTFAIAFLAGCTFSFPKIGYLMLSFLAVFVIPPFIWVGIVQTKGYCRAFCLGAAVSGVPHFFYSVYFGLTLGIGLYQSLPIYPAPPSGVSQSQTPGLFESIDPVMVYAHSIPILFGCFGGLMGMLAFRLMVASHKTRQ